MLFCYADDVPPPSLRKNMKIPSHTSRARCLGSILPTELTSPTPSSAWYTPHCGHLSGYHSKFHLPHFKHAKCALTHTYAVLAPRPSDCAASIYQLVPYCYSTFRVQSTVPFAENVLGTVVSHAYTNPPRTFGHRAPCCRTSLRKLRITA